MGAGVVFLVPADQGAEKLGLLDQLSEPLDDFVVLQLGVFELDREPPLDREPLDDFDPLPKL